MITLRIKRGQTVSVACTDNFPPGSWDITGQVRNQAGVKYADIVFYPDSVTSTDINDDQSFLMTIDESVTKDFPLSSSTSKLFVDFFYRDEANSVNLVSETFMLNVDVNITDIPL